MSALTEKKLNALQRWFVRLMLQVGPGAPRASLLWDFGLLDMGLRIWMEKLMLVLHVRRLTDDTLARNVYDEQRAQQWPGLAAEADEICLELGIENVHDTGLSAKAYRAVIIEACHIKNEARIKSEAEGKEKCERIFKEKYGAKEYTKNKEISKVRQAFRTRFGLQPFAGNYGHDRRFAQTEWLCCCRQAKEDETHLINGHCEVYGGVREKYGNLTNDESLIAFFNEVLSMRDKLEEGEREENRR